MKINGNNKKVTVLTFNLKSMDTRMKLCAPSRLLPPHDDLNNLNEATITFDDWCEIDALIDALQRFSDENKRCAGYWEQHRDYCSFYGDKQYLIAPRGAAKFMDMYKQVLNANYGVGMARMLPEIADVIFSGPATIVQWTDGTKTVVKCSKDENFDPEKGLVMAITKKALGNKGNYYETIKKWMHPGVTVLKIITVKSNGIETEINKVSSSDIEKIIDTMKPEGNFYCYDKKNKEYIAVDNTTGEAFTESFKDKKSCLDWLENKEKTISETENLDARR